MPARSKAKPWVVKVRVWLERESGMVLGPGRSELLGHIDRLHSISAAAREMGMSYRRAWGHVQAMNAVAGQDLVAVTSGGVGGGGATLTEHGKELLTAYQSLVEHVSRAATTHSLSGTNA